ncbi:MFS transporter [Catellatospora sp. KI3]|uniref:MFS transporter n=1 Tax=Catellatospora sp. KI3 TaxID=3041620 RepID=UPI00248291DD|nr:MFS transporter [Catellatospora sp. KI3]MDI1463969.1 MFS transporter [Catellatospora sp. KI3]
MATRTEGLVVNIAGVVQGIVLVTIPAASTIFTDPAEYGLSSTRYGGMFLPQVVLAITASLLGALLSRRWGTKPVYLAGLGCSLLSMVLLLASIPVMHQAGAYPLLLGATAALGAGFGLAVPALNSLAAAFHPGRVDSAVLVLNALLGLGTALAPVFVALFVGLGFWWGLPVLSTLLLVGLLLVSLPLPMRTATAAPAAGGRSAVPARFWAYAAFAVLYGMCETVNGNWSTLDITGSLGGSATTAALALTAFWAMVTLGRIGFAAAHSVIGARTVYHSLPFLLAAVFVLIALLPSGMPGLAVLAFGMAGIGCSALLPLTISFGQAELTPISGAVAGGVIACYQLGYGIAAFGVGPVLAAGVRLPTVYAVAAVIAALMGLLSFAVAHRRPSPATLHPRPPSHVAPAAPSP